MYNKNQCMARKNMKNGINTQCSYKQRFGEYCGFHKDKRLRIDEPLPLNYKSYLKNFVHPSKPVQKLPALKLKTNIKIIDNEISTKLITLDDYMRGTHLKSLVKDLRYTLAHYNQPTYGIKSDLIDRLSKYFNKIVIYQPHLDKIIKIQRNYRKYLNNKILKVRGPGYFDRKICLNDYDFYTCEDKIEIDAKYFISYMDDKNFIYCFDVRSLIKLNENSNGKIPINPYNLNEIPISVMENAEYIINQLKTKSQYEDFEEQEMTSEQLHRDKIIKVFHKLDELDNHTKSEWFTKLSIKNLFKFYNSLHDIWVYRAGLTDKIRNDIVPEGNLFKLSHNQIANFKDKKKVQNILIGIIDKLISSAEVRSDRVLGSLYVLTALSEVSKECGQANQFLLQ